MTNHERNIFEVANQLSGYIDESTPNELAEFLRKESREAEKLANRIIELEQEVKQLHRQATDRLYKIEAYRQMLGPIGLEVADSWMKRGITRVHYSWGPDAAKMTGEERAKIILDLEN